MSGDSLNMEWDVHNFVILDNSVLLAFPLSMKRHWFFTLSKIMVYFKLLAYQTSKY